MTHPQDPRKSPLQDDEIALARVLRALPSGEPPAQLDTAILRAATDALSPGRRRPVRGLRWLPTWAVGTAAAAVLAVGVGIQLRPPLAPQYPAAGVQETSPVKPEARERMDIELIEADQAAAPAPAAAPPEPRPVTGRPPPPAAPAPALQSAPPPPIESQSAAVPEEAAAPMVGENTAQDASVALDSVVVSGSRVRSEATDQARRTPQESYARRAQAKVARPQPQQAQPRAELAPADRAGLADGAAANPAAPAAFTDAKPTGAALPPVADDAALAPADWFDRIRERRRQGDLAGARASLQLFVRAYPTAPIPSDLARLR